MMKLTKKNVLKLLQLLEEETRAEIMARHGECVGLEFGDFFKIHLEKKDEIRKLVFGDDDLVTLGLTYFHILKEKDNGKPKKIKERLLKAKLGCQARSEVPKKRKAKTKNKKHAFRNGGLL